jgi:hypothetical protein
VSPSPLDDTIRRASGLEVAGWPLVIARRDAPGDGFERADELHRPGPLLDDCIDASAALGGTGHRHVGAQWWFERCAFLVAGVALACVLTARRVPSLRPQDTLVVTTGGIPSALGLREAPLACAEAGDARLAAAARAQIEGHLEPLAAAITAQRLRPAKALWRSAGDRTVQAALWVGTATGRREDAVALAHAVLTPDCPAYVPVRLTRDAEDPDCDHLRSSCCLAHRADGGEICAACPRTHRLDRARRVAA